MVYSEREICNFYKNADLWRDRIKLIHELTLLDKETIIDILNRNGIEVSEYKPDRSSNKRLTCEKYLEYYNQGLCDSEIAKITSVSDSTARYYRKKLSLPKIKKHRTAGTVAAK